MPRYLPGPRIPAGAADASSRRTATETACFFSMARSSFLRVNLSGRVGERGVEGFNQFVDGAVRRVEHEAGAYDVAVEAAFADEDAAALGLFEDFKNRLRV